MTSKSSFERAQKLFYGYVKALLAILSLQRHIDSCWRNHSVRAGTQTPPRPQRHGLELVHKLHHRILIADSHLPFVSIYPNL